MTTREIWQKSLTYYLKFNFAIVSLHKLSKTFFKQKFVTNVNKNKLEILHHNCIDEKQALACVKETC